MGSLVFGDNFEASDFSSAAKFQTIKFNKNVIVRAFRTWIIVYNDPVFTNLNMKIYSNDVVSGDNTPKLLLHTSTDVRTKAEIHTLANGIKEIYFTFADINFQANTLYNVVINGTGYAPTLTSYLNWMHGFPDPVCDTDYIAAMETLSFSPYQVYAIGAEL